MLIQHVKPGHIPTRLDERGNSFPQQAVPTLELALVFCGQFHLLSVSYQAVISSLIVPSLPLPRQKCMFFSH